jgi:hypothetical protein
MHAVVMLVYLGNDMAVASKNTSQKNSEVPQTKLSKKQL